MNVLYPVSKIRMYGPVPEMCVASSPGSCLSVVMSPSRGLSPDWKRDKVSNSHNIGLSHAEVTPGL